MHVKVAFTSFSAWAFHEVNRWSRSTVKTAEGTVDTDKDFGYGYHYDVLVEDATFND